MCDQLYQKPIQLKSHTNETGYFFGALGFTVPVEELTVRMASLMDVLCWLTQPQGPHLVDDTSAQDSFMDLAILVTPKALQNAFFQLCTVLLLVILFLILSCPKCVLVGGNCCERLLVEIFVRVLRSSRVNFNNVNNTNMFSYV